MSATTTTTTTTPLLLRSLKLPSFVDNHELFAEKAERESWSFVQYLRALVDTEIADRRTRRIARIIDASDVPSDKTMATLDAARLPIKIRRQLQTLGEGAFVERGENILAFGLPGRGKTHLCCAVAHELMHRGYRVLFTPAFKLVHGLLRAKRDLELEKELHRLDTFDVILLDDIGNVQHAREEMEVLFTFLAERYERRSVMITSNLVFSQWDRIFKDPMTTAAAIDRLVHHAIILELTGDSYRTETAEKRNKPRAKTAGEPSTDGEE
jgi:DNA replication protein DnaC